MRTVNARVHDGDDNGGISEGNSPGRRRRDRRRSPLVESSVVGARVHRAVIGIVRFEERLYDGVELGELYVRSVAQVRQEPQCPFRRRLEMHDADLVYGTDDLCAEGGVELVEHVPARGGLESNQDVTSAYAA